MAAPEMKNWITLGNLITIAVLLAGLIAGWVRLESQVSEQNRRMDGITAASTDREVRLRAVELTQASQSSDLRAIQASLGRIERLLESRQ